MDCAFAGTHTPQHGDTTNPSAGRAARNMRCEMVMGAPPISADPIPYLRHAINAAAGGLGQLCMYRPLAPDRGFLRLYLLEMNLLDHRTPSGDVGFDALLEFVRAARRRFVAEGVQLRDRRRLQQDA